MAAEMEMDRFHKRFKVVRSGFKDFLSLDFELHPVYIMIRICLFSPQANLPFHLVVVAASFPYSSASDHFS